MKVLYICSEPSPYRVDFFNLLGEKCELTALFAEKADTAEKRDPLWYRENYAGFEALFLNNDEDNKLDLNALISKGGFNIIVVCNFYAPLGMKAIAYMKTRRIPYGIEIDGGIPYKKSGVKELAKKLLIGSASFYLSPGVLPDEYLMLYGADKDKIYRYNFTSLYESDILPDALTQTQKQSLRDKLNMPEKKIVISVGQFIYRKGYDILLETCKALNNDTGVYIIGGEATREYIELKEKYSLDNVHFVGFKQKEALGDYYRAADLFVLPTREDIWGLVINEAMANALPVITTDNCVAGTELVKEGENGYVVKTGSSEALVNSINELMSDENKCLSYYSVSSLERIREYTFEHMTRQHIAVYKKILSDRGKE